MVQEKAFPVETANSVPLLVEVFLDHNLGKNQNNFVRSECACHLWRHACTGSSTRAEIVKLGALNKLVETADRGDKQACFHALGCLLQFVETEDFKTLILAYTGAKLVRCLGECLNNVAHPRTQLQASRILVSIANNPETTGRLVSIVPKLVQALDVTGPTWGRRYEICAQVAQVLKHLSLASSESQSTLQTGGYSGGKNAKSVRKDMLSKGIVGNCVEVLKCPSDAVGAVAGEVDEVKIAALAVLHSLLDEPQCIDDLRSLDRALPCLAATLSLASVDAKAHSAGCLLSLSENKRDAAKIGATGAVPELVRMLSVKQEKTKSKKKSKKKGGADSPVTGAALCLENAAGLLLQLTVCEENTEEMVREGAIPVLVGLLKSKGSSLAVMQYTTCILASIGLNEDYHDMLIDSQAPLYLIKRDKAEPEDQ